MHHRLPLQRLACCRGPRRLRHHHHPILCSTQRTLAVSLKQSIPSSDPLALWRDECRNRNLCDNDGDRRPDVHWVVTTATASSHLNQAPNVRTIGVERISPLGVDFVLKANSPVVDKLLDPYAQPLALVQQQGKFLPGESAVQWRAEGVCQALDVDDVLSLIPPWTVTSLVTSFRLGQEQMSSDKNSSTTRTPVLSKTHMTEIVQKTRMEVDSGRIDKDLLRQSIAAFRLQPDRVERMMGGPDTIVWERWEWKRNKDGGSSADGMLQWSEPQQLLPH